MKIKNVLCLLAMIVLSACMSLTIYAGSLPQDKNVQSRETERTKIQVLGSNVIYLNESYTYTFQYSNKKSYKHKIKWTLSSDKGTVNKNGKVTAKEKGTAILTVKDKTLNIKSSMLIHFINPDDDVDFVTEIKGIKIVNKSYKLPKDYDPGLDKNALNAFNKLKADAAKEGLTFFILSGYRSYDTQQYTYQKWVNKFGKEYADRCSARPGFSEHQLGLAIDVNSCYYDFLETPEAAWLAKNCHKYGFIIRYPSQKAEKITGYIYEPWHIRYLGVSEATDVYNSGLTLEEYLGIDSYYRT